MIIKIIINCDYDESSSRTEQMGRAWLQGALSNIYIYIYMYDQQWFQKWSF